MKVIIQIPCFNEEVTLPSTFADLPRKIEGVDRIEYQVIDDGSTDRTVEIARELGIHHIIQFSQNRGLAEAFKAGVDNAIRQGADVLVNTDADNQYNGADIEKLVQPILASRADMVIGNRPILTHREFSLFKKGMQLLGSFTLRFFSNTKVRDAASGFRAYNVNALLHLNIYTQFSYCMETLVQMGVNNMRIEQVDIRVNPKTRPSRLFRTIFEYIWKSARTIIKIFILYRGQRFFSTLGAIFFLVAFALGARYMILSELHPDTRSNFWPTLIFAGSCLAVGFQLALTGIIADLVGANRKLLEDILYRKRLEDYSHGKSNMSKIGKQASSEAHFH